jgi:DNA primase
LGQPGGANVAPTLASRSSLPPEGACSALGRPGGGTGHTYGMAIPQTFIQELVARADVVEIVGRYVPLKKAGANFMGLCPFHGEKSPSFSVSPTKQFYHCFGCGKNGNAISFLMDHAGMTFIEAVKDLAQQYGMQVPEEEGTPQDRARAQEQRAKQQTLNSVLEKAGEAYRKHLKDSPRAIAYFKSRGVSGEVAKQFGLGYAPEGWRSLSSVFPHYDDPLLVESGLVISSVATSPPATPGNEAQPAAQDATEEKRYDRFRDRVMFPIRNIKGECIGFGGRVLGDDKPKYLNSPETPVFSKGRELYGLFEARAALREQGYVLVTEGYMDVVALAQLGFPNAVATLGTACTTEHVQKLFRFTDSVVFSFDGDAAGRRAAHKALDGALPFATDVRSVKFLFLPPEHDPDSFIRANGREAFARYVSEAMPLSRFLIESAREGCDLNTAEGRAHLSSNAKPLWSAMPEGALKMQLLGEIADLVQLTGRELSALWNPTAAASHAPREGGWRKSRPEFGQGGFGQSGGYRQLGNRPRLGGRSQPASRADHATRILLGQSCLWDTLSNEDHGLLCELPPPHGPLLAWLEGQMHEHGPLPWEALREALAGQPGEEDALRLMSGMAIAVQPQSESAPELRDLLNRMLIDRLKVQETDAIEASKADPQALQRYRALQARRLQLEKNQSEGILDG